MTAQSLQGYFEQNNGRLNQAEGKVAHAGGRAAASWRLNSALDFISRRTLYDNDRCSREATQRVTHSLPQPGVATVLNYTGCVFTPQGRGTNSNTNT